MAGKLTYSDLRRLAHSAAFRADVQADVYGDADGRRAFEKAGFDRIEQLIGVFEDNEADILKIVEGKRERVLKARAAADKSKGAGKTSDNGGD